MIAFTYAISGRACSRSAAICSQQGCSTRRDADPRWTVVFFFASAAASSAYLTVSETFPLEIRALAIAALLRHRHRRRRRRRPGAVRGADRDRLAASIFGGYLFGAALMLAAAVVAWIWGVAAERKPLEAVARPLAFRD